MYLHFLNVYLGETISLIKFYVIKFKTITWSCDIENVIYTFSENITLSSRYRIGRYCVSYKVSAQHSEAFHSKSLKKKNLLSSMVSVLERPSERSRESKTCVRISNCNFHRNDLYRWRLKSVQSTHVRATISLGATIKRNIKRTRAWISRRNGMRRVIANLAFASAP